jgi:hypothetical protein
MWAMNSVPIADRQKPIYRDPQRAVAAFVVSAQYDAHFTATVDGFCITHEFDLSVHR